MIKKTLLLLLVLTVLIATVSGCKPGDRSKTQEPAATQVEFTATPELVPTTTVIPDIDVDAGRLKGLQIHFLHPWTGKTGEEITRLIDIYNQTNIWGIHVIEIAPGSSELATSVLWASVDQKELPELAVVSNDLLLALDEKAGAIVDMNPYVMSKKFGMDQDRIDDFNPVFWNEDVFQGKRIGIPAVRTAAVIIYNKTWASELGFSTTPLKMDDFRAQMCAANAAMRTDIDNTNDGVGGWITNNTALSMLSWLDSLGGVNPLVTDGLFDSPQNVTIFSFLRELLVKNCAWNTELYSHLNPLQKDSVDWETRVKQPYEYFSGRLSLAYSGEIQDAIKQTQVNKRNNVTDAWVMLPYPSLTDNSILTEGQSYGILKNEPKDQLAAWLFIRWLSEPAQQASLLQTEGTLPLGADVLDLMSDFLVQYPQWTIAVKSLTDLKTLKLNADWEVISKVVEDGGRQLFKTDIRADAIPALLLQMDDLAKELSERYP